MLRKINIEVSREKKILIELVLFLHIFMKDKEKNDNHNSYNLVCTTINVASLHIIARFVSNRLKSSLFSKKKYIQHKILYPFKHF